MPVRLLLPLQWIQTALWERHRVRTLRRTLEQIADDSVASLADDGSLTVSGELPSLNLLREADALWRNMCRCFVALAVMAR